MGVASPDRGNVASLAEGGWIEVTIASRGVEISITVGVVETEDVENDSPFFFESYVFV